MHLLIWVWATWTDREILDLWRAPKPWRFETKSMEFSEGGRWHYAMVGPNGEKQNCLFDYKKIDAQEQVSGADAFCDKNGTINDTEPECFWGNTFTQNSENTVVSIQISL